MALGAEVIDLIRHNLLDDPDQVDAIREIALIEYQARVDLVRVLDNVINRLVLRLLPQRLIP